MGEQTEADFAKLWEKIKMRHDAEHGEGDADRQAERGRRMMTDHNPDADELATLRTRLAEVEAENGRLREALDAQKGRANAAEARLSEAEHKLYGAP